MPSWVCLGFWFGSFRPFIWSLVAAPVKIACSLNSKLSKSQSLERFGEKSIGRIRAFAGDSEAFQTFLRDRRGETGLRSRSSSGRLQPIFWLLWRWAYFCGLFDVILGACLWPTSGGLDRKRVVILESNRLHTARRQRVVRWLQVRTGCLAKSEATCSC